MLNATPGPWRFNTDMGEFWIQGPDPRAPVICDLVPRKGHWKGFESEYTPEDEANGHLLGASLRLFEAADAALRELELCGRAGGPVGDELRAAISQAMGGPGC